MSLKMGSVGRGFHFCSWIWFEHSIKTIYENIVKSLFSTRRTPLLEQKDKPRLQSSAGVHFRLNKNGWNKLPYSLQEKIHYCWLFYWSVRTWPALSDLSSIAEGNDRTFLRLWRIFWAWVEFVFSGYDRPIAGDQKISTFQTSSRANTHGYFCIEIQ